MTTQNNIVKSEEFLSGFAAGAQIRESEADEQWAGFSRQLSDSERAVLESKGYRAGFNQGEEFAKLYPVSERDETL